MEQLGLNIQLWKKGWNFWRKVEISSLSLAFKNYKGVLDIVWLRSVEDRVSDLIFLLNCLRVPCFWSSCNCWKLIPRLLDHNIQLFRDCRLADSYFDFRLLFFYMYRPIWCGWWLANFCHQTLVFFVWILQTLWPDLLFWLCWSSLIFSYYRSSIIQNTSSYDTRYKNQTVSIFRSISSHSSRTFRLISLKLPLIFVVVRGATF